MEGKHRLEDYRPRPHEAQLVLTVEPPSSIPTLLTLAVVGAMLAAMVTYAVGAPTGIALVLSGLFSVAGASLMPTPTRTTLRILNEGIEVAAEGYIWVRVPWQRVQRLVIDHNGASLITGTQDEDGTLLARLPTPLLSELLAAEILPHHVTIVEAPSVNIDAAQNFVWGAFLIFCFVALWIMATQ